SGGFMSGASTASAHAQAAEPKKRVVDVAPIPGYDPSSVAGWRLDPVEEPGGSPSDSASRPTAAEAAKALQAPAPLLDAVFPHEPNAKAFLREREDTTAPHGRAHASVQTLPEDVQVHETSNQRFAREAVARIGLVPLTICDAAACPEFRLQRML
ncbi:unnamed protein product, partial [Symbiodinium pilosum]